MLDPAVFATKPPTGIATTVAVTEESDETETELGETLRTAPGRGCTTKVMDLVTVKPSPITVIVGVVVPAVATVEAVSVNVEEPVSLVSVTGLTLHEAVTPAGNPLTLKLAAPL